MGSLRALACALALSLTALVFMPPAVLGQDAPADEATTEETATEDAAAEDTPTEDTAAEDTATEDVAAEDAAEEKKAWNVAAPCENIQHPYESDLCQQWRAAEAAESSARLTRLLAWIAAIATLLLMLMFVPLVMALQAARRTARDDAPVPVSSGGGGGAGEEELRAYVDVDKLEFIETPESEGVVKVKVVFRNSGQTPAFNIKSTAAVGIRDVSNEDLLPVMRLPERSALDSARPRLGRDATDTDIVTCESTPSLADRVMGGDATILVWGVVEYLDVFDRTHKTAFQYLCNADTLDTGQIFKPMVRGDEEG